MKTFTLSLLLITAFHAMAQSGIRSDRLPQPSDITYAVPATEVTIAPNPAKDHIWVSIPLPASGTSDIVIHDMLGRRLSTQRTNTQETMLNISQWHQGVYLLSANTKDGMVTKRFIKVD